MFGLDVKKYNRRHADDTRGKPFLFTNILQSSPQERILLASKVITFFLKYVNHVINEML